MLFSVQTRRVAPNSSGAVITTAQAADMLANVAKTLRNYLEDVKQSELSWDLMNTSQASKKAKKQSSFRGSELLSFGSVSSTTARFRREVMEGILCSAMLLIDYLEEFAFPLTCHLEGGNSEAERESIACLNYSCSRRR